ncbi:hypothetical protein NE237_019032 [Protea cynaroides]|uniref:Uncharacterized protein n=1 Tax=Protea cynaroides TaxID=273540 RepID=A0A9Q0QPL2_9MAGN|nr:hypothetical protein NE237_019032 [Protea cynaroides]
MSPCTEPSQNLRGSIHNYHLRSLLSAFGKQTPLQGSDSHSQAPNPTPALHARVDSFSELSLFSRAFRRELFFVFLTNVGSLLISAVLLRKIHSSFLDYVL